MHFKRVHISLTGSSRKVSFQLFKDKAVLSMKLFMGGEKWCNDSLKMFRYYVPTDLQISQITASNKKIAVKVNSERKKG